MLSGLTLNTALAILAAVFVGVAVGATAALVRLAGQPRRRRRRALPKPGVCPLCLDMAGRPGGPHFCGRCGRRRVPPGRAA